MQTDEPDNTNALDGSAADVKRFLRELAELIGQDPQSHIAPVVELQFGDVFTATSLSVAEGAACLSITALLPRDEQLDYSPHSPATSAIVPNGECLWHADEGRYVVVRKMPIAELPDERSVMDTILDTADLAAAWFAEARRRAVKSD